MSLLKPQVKVLNTSGRFAFKVHRERAEGMLFEGSAVYEAPTLIRLTATVRMTSEMAAGPIRRQGPRVRKADSSHGDAGRGFTLRARYTTVHTPNSPTYEPVLRFESSQIGRKREV
jgi:hypothetical protein